MIIIPLTIDVVIVSTDKSPRQRRRKLYLLRLLSNLLLHPAPESGETYSLRLSNSKRPQNWFNSIGTWVFVVTVSYLITNNRKFQEVPKRFARLRTSKIRFDSHPELGLAPRSS